MTTDRELAAAVRARAGADRVEILERRPLAGEPGGSGAFFERAVLSIDGSRREAIRKEVAPDPLLRTHERRFYEELAPGLPIRVPELLASGPLAGKMDGWLLLEAVPAAAGVGADAANVLALARGVARMHASRLADPPAWLPRPFSDGLEEALAHVPEGVERLRARMERRPALRRLASPEILERAAALARDPAPLRDALAASPETVVHRDLHHHNVFFPRGADPVVFDWEAVSAGPPLFDLAVLHLYLGIERLRMPASWPPLFWLRRRPLSWDALLGAYLDALADAVPDLDRGALLRSAPACFLFEIVHRIGWVDGQLDAVSRAAAASFALPPGLALEGERTGAVMLHAWSRMFRELPRLSARLAAG